MLLPTYGKNQKVSISMAELKKIATQTLEPHHEKKSQYKFNFNSILQIWKKWNLDEVAQKKDNVIYSEETICQLIENRIKTLAEYDFDNEDKLLEISDDISHIFTISLLLKKTGDERKALKIKQDIDLLNCRVQQSVFKKISSLREDSAIQMAEKSVNVIKNREKFNETIKKIHAICLKLSKYSTSKKEDNEFLYKEAQKLVKLLKKINLEINNFDLIDQLEDNLMTWKEELISIASGNCIDFAGNNHLAVLKNCCDLVQNTNSDLEERSVQKIKKELQKVAHLQNQVVSKFCDYFVKYLQAIKSQIEQEEPDSIEYEESLATFNYFIKGLEKGILEIEFMCSMLNQELVPVEGKPMPFAKEIRNILDSLNKHHMALCRLKDSTPRITSTLDVDVPKQWDSLQIRHTFRFQNPDMINSDEAVKAASKQFVDTGIHEITPPAPVLKLNSLKNIAMIGLYCLKFPLQYSHAVDEFTPPVPKDNKPGTHHDMPVNSDPDLPNPPIHPAPLPSQKGSSIFHHIVPKKHLSVAEEIADIVQQYRLWNSEEIPEDSFTVDVSSSSGKKAANLSPSEEIITFFPTCRSLKNVNPAPSIKASVISIEPILENKQLMALASKHVDVKRLLTFLSSPVHVDSKTFAHLIGHDNPMIHEGQDAGIPFEGMTFNAPLDYQLSIAEAMFSAMQQVQIAEEASSFQKFLEWVLGVPSIAKSIKENPALLENLIEQLGIAKYIQEPSKNTPNSNIDEYRNRIIEKVNSLGNGQSFFFLGGWIGEKIGHGLTWVVTKQQDGKLTIRLHNTGSGLEYHFSKIIGFEERFLLVTEIKDVDPKQFTSSSFIQGVFNLQNLKLPAVQEWKARDIYLGLLVGMGGSVSLKQYALSDLARPQFVGICAMEAVMSAMSSFIDEEPSAILYRFWATLHSAISYFEQIKNTTISHESEEQRRLLYDGAKIIASLAEKAQKAGVLTDGELVSIKIITREINQHLQLMEKRSAEETVKKEPLVTFEIPPHSLQADMQGLQFNYSSGVKGNREQIKALVCIESEAFVANPHTIVQDLNVLLKEIHLGNHERHNYLEVQKAIRGIVLKIPLLDAPFWSKIDEASAHQLLTIFADMSKELLWSLINNDELPLQKMHLSPEDYLCQAKLLTLADYILHNYNNSLGMKLPSLFQEIAWKTQGTPEWEIQHSIMNEYWQQFFQNNTIEQNEDFFGFKLYPAGNTRQMNFRFNMNDNLLRVHRDKHLLLAKQFVLPKWHFGYYDEHGYPIQPKQFDFARQWANENLEKIKGLDPNFKISDDPTTVILQHINQLPPLRDAFLISYVFSFLSTGSFDKPTEKTVFIKYHEQGTPREEAPSYYTGPILGSALYENEEVYNFSKGISIHTEMLEKEIHFTQSDTRKKISCSGMSYSLFGRSPYISDRSANHVNEIVVLKDFFYPYHHELAHIKLQRLLKNKQIEFHKYLSALFNNTVNFYDDIELNRTDSADVVVKDGPEKQLQQYREIQNLYSNSSVQIEQTFGYFLGKNSENTYLMSKPKFQVLFHFLITDGDLLNQRIKKNQHAALEMAADYQNALISAQNNAKDVNLIIFLAGMSARLQEVYEKEKERDPILFSSIDVPQFVNAPVILASIMQSKEINTGQRAFASRELAISFRRQATLTPGEAALLIQAVINTRIYILPEVYRHTEITHEVDLLIRNHFMPQLRELMQGQYRDQILSHVLSTIIPDAPTGEWTSPDNFPYYVSPCKYYRLNIIEGSIKPINTGIVTPFDKSLLENNKFVKEIFSHDPPDIMTKTNEGIGIKSKIGDSYNLIDDNLFRKFNDTWYHEGTWYQLQESNSIKFENRAILAGNHIWCLTYSTSYGSYIKGKGAAIATDQNSKQAIYRMELETSNKQWQVQKIIKLDSQGQDTDLILVDSNRKELDTFRRLEAPEYIIAWSQGGVLKYVELPRFNLTFTIKEIEGKRLAFSSTFPGYVLVEGAKQHVPQLGNIRHYLHLQRIENDCSVSEKVIFARQPLKPYTQGSYVTDAEPDKNIRNDTALHPQKYIDYQLLKGELIPSTTDEKEAIEANLFLAMTHLAERHSIPSDKNTNPYAQSLGYLEKASHQIFLQREGLSNNTLEILTWMLNETVTKDRHPDAIAIRLKAQVILGRNLLDFKSNISVPEAFDLNNYTAYLAHLNYVDASLRLNQGDELHLLNMIGIKDERLAYRFQQLTNETNVIQETFNGNESTFINSNSLLNSTINPSWSVPFKSSWNWYGEDTWLRVLIDNELNKFQNPIFLRNINTINSFTDYYAIAKGELSTQDSIKILNSKMGLHLRDSLYHNEMIQEMKTALKMSLASDGNRVDGIVIKILLAVATDPSQFKITHDELSQQLKKLKDKSETRDRYASYNGGYWEKEIATLNNEISEFKNYFNTHLKTPVNNLENSIKLSINFSQKTEVLKRSDVAKQLDSSIRKVPSFAECINLASGMDARLSNRTIGRPIIPMQVMGQFVQKAPKQPALRNSPALSLPLFQGTPKNPGIVEFFAAAENALAEYTTSSFDDDSIYEVTNSGRIIDLEKALFQNVAILGKEIRDQEVELLKFANRGPARIGERAARDLQMMQGSLKLLTLHELNRAFFQRDFEILHKRNSYLSKEEIAQLFTKIENFLLDATYLQQQIRVLKKAEALKKCMNNNLEGPELQENIRAFMETAESTRAYNPHEYPEYLVFEYYQDILLWKPQVDTLSAFNKKDRWGALIELGMGLGKSQVITPFLAWLAADGEQIAAILTTGALLPSLAKDLQETNKRVFAQQTRTLAIKREEITIERLQRLFDNLNEIRNERFALALSANDLLCLFNQWVELNELAYELQARNCLLEYVDAKIEKKCFLTKAFELKARADLAVKRKQYKSFGWEWSEDREYVPNELFNYVTLRNLFIKNFQFLKAHASLTVDEIHKVFDILQSHSFTFGRPKEVHSDITSGVIRLINTIISDENLYNTIRWEFLPQSEGESFTEESYLESIKGKIIDSLIDHSLALSSGIYREFFEKITPQEKQQLKAYLADGAGADPGYRLLRNLEQEKKIESSTAKKIRNELATLKESINNVFSKTAAKKPLVDAGEDADKKLIIPYHDGVPTVNSLHKNILERLFYTIEYDLSQGVSVDVVRQKMQQLKNKYDASDNKEVHLLEFNRLVGGSTKFNLIKLFNNKDYAENNYAKIAKIINKQPKVVLELIAEYRLPNIKVYAKSIESSAHIIPLLAKEDQGVRGMSGTLYNVPTYPKIFQPTQLSKTQVKTLYILRKNSASRVVTLPAARGIDTLNMTYVHEIEPAASRIDATGALCGLRNEEIARFMLKKLTAEKGSKIQGVVYYEGDVRKVVTIKDSKPIAYHKEMDKESLAAFWDLPHFTGSDIPLGQFMKTNIIVGKDITLVSMMQAAWRSRGLAKGQKVNFMVQENDKRVIIKLLKNHLAIEIPNEKDLTFSHLVSYAALNQELQEGPKNYQAVQESMKVAFIKHLSYIMWDETLSAEDSLQIYKDTRSLFVTEEAEEPWDLWGRPVQEVSTLQVLQDMLKEWKEKHPVITKIRNNPTLYNKLDLYQLFKDWDKIIENISGPLPETVKTGTESCGKTTEQTVEQLAEEQIEQTSEQHVEQQTEKEVYLYDNENPLLARQRIPIDNPFLLKDSIPTSIKEFEDISEDILVKRTKTPTLQETGLCVKVNDLMQKNEKTKGLGNIFNENLLISLNLAPVQRPSKSGQQIYTPFDKFQKSCTFVQVIQEKKTGKIKLKLIDEREAADLKDFVRSEQSNAEKVSSENNADSSAILNVLTKLFHSDSHEVRIGLYQLQKTFYTLDNIGGQPINLKNQKIYKNFMELLVQAKFAAGKTHFQHEEIPYLEKWLIKADISKAFQLIDVILNPVAKGETRSYFSTSPLAKIFEKHGISRQHIESIK